jgi:amino acid adenylation domain-containing protein
MTSNRIDTRRPDGALSPEASALLERRSRVGHRITSIPSRDTAAGCPLSFEQQMVWLSAQLDKASPVFNHCVAVRITGELDCDALTRALSGIIRRHAILRSRVLLRDDAPVLDIGAAPEICLEVVDVSEAPIQNRADRVREIIDAEIAKPFELDNGPLIRIGLIRESEVASTLCITTHHIVTDGWSDGVMFRELDSLYRAFVSGEPSPLEDLGTQYTDFAAWQRDPARPSEVSGNIEYWRARMSGAPVAQRLPTDRPRPDLPDMSAGQVKLEVPAALAVALKSIARHHGTTPAAMMLAAFHVLQFRISGTCDSVVGLSLAGRTLPEVRPLIGLFSKVLPVRVAIDRDMSFVTLLKSVHAAAAEAQAHQDVPVDSLVQALPSSRGARHPEIAQSIFNFRNMLSFEPSLSGLEVEPLEMFNGASVADLDLEVIERNAGFECALRFRRNLFDSATAERLLDHYSTLLASIALDPDETVGRLRILTDAERRQILVDFNGPVRDFGRPRFLDQLFAEQAKRTPALTAVSSAGGALTYAQLDRCSDALGRSLKSLGISAGDFVGVCMDRSLEMIVALVAILKCGAAFVPLDVEYPPDRLAHMVRDTKPKLLVADAKGDSLLGPLGVPVLRAAPDWTSPDASKESQFFVDRPDNAVACVLYTSGSTGLPKGVLSTHRGIANNLCAMQEKFSLAHDDCMLQQTTLGFDAAAWEIFWPLSAGARTFLARGGGQRDADYVLELIAEHRIRTIGFAPSMLKVMLGMPAFTGNADIKLILSYGEVLSPGLVSGLFQRMPNVEISNLYGPTETSIIVTSWKCERRSLRRSIPIGRPIANNEVYLLDAALEPVPIGVEGEIYIGGVCVSNGYHDRPELTSQRFRPHPFRPESADRVYQTGDIARFDADGVIEYIGRRDHQLKIRGLRVELEEVESALVRLRGVRESVVVPQRNGDDEMKLVAYVAVDSDAGTPWDIVRELEKSLPPQFIPSQIICLDSLPHALNGKIDRQRLPDPSSVVPTVSRLSEEPRGETEMRLADIWKDLLDGRDAGVTDSFFYVGGHSLLAVRMLQRIADELKVKVSLRAFYQEPTIRAVASLISGEAAELSPEGNAPILRISAGTVGSNPLFYLNGQPPGGGTYAHNLARFLPTDQGLSIVPVPIFENPVTVEHVAAQMLTLIRGDQACGPYMLGGNCFGATLALEIAQQLAAAGEEVSLLMLVHPDARTPMHLGYRAMRRMALLAGLSEEIHFAEFTGAFDFTVTTIRQVIGAQRRSSRGERLQRLSQMGTWLKAFVVKNARRPGIMWKALRDRAPREADERIQEEMRRDTRPAVTFNADGDQTAQMEIAAHVKYMSDAWTAYTPEPYVGRVAIIWPREGPANPPWNPQAVWSRLTPDVDWRWVPGNHWTMFHAHFDDSARTIGEALHNHRSRQ